MILNLIDYTKSDVLYTIDRYPDGQNNIRINTSVNDNYVTIATRLTSWIDLEILVCTVKSLRSCSVSGIDLRIHYMLGARSDRKFEFNGNHYLKDVIAPVINSLKLNRIFVFEPHSDVTEAVLDKYVDDHITTTWFNKMAFSLTGLVTGKFTLVCPDAGAMKRVSKFAKTIEYKDEIVLCSKERTSESTIVTKVHFDNYTVYSKKFLIVDDICDGGRTFINIAEEIKAFVQDAEVYLIVSHGIFSAGLKELAENFKSIVISNSYMDVTKGDFAIRNDKHLHLIKQVIL